MKYLLHSLVLLSLLDGMITGNISAEKANQVNKKQRLIAYELLEKQIFEDASGIMKPEQTLNKLRALKHALVNVDKKKVKEESSELFWLRKRVMDLINYSMYKEEKCQWMYLHEFKSKLEHPGNSISIDNYLEYYWKEQLLACENYLDTTLRAELDELTFDNVRLLDLLQINLWKSIPPYFDRYSHSELRSLTSPVLAYLELNLNYDTETLLDCKRGKALFEQEFVRLTTNVCNTMIEKLCPSLDIYKLYSEYELVFTNKPTIALDWLVTKDICEIITQNQDFLIPQVYKEFKRKHMKKAGLKQKMLYYLFKS